MTATDNANKALNIASKTLKAWRESNTEMKAILEGRYDKRQHESKSSRLPAAGRDHPAFARHFNAKLVAYGMDQERSSMKHIQNYRHAVTAASLRDER